MNHPTPTGSEAAKTLLVAIPCLNEEATIGEIVARVPREVAEVRRVDVLVVDDGSSDETGDSARRAGALVIRHPVNRGVGAAFQTAVTYAVENGYDVMVNIDGDGQFRPEDIPKLVIPVAQGKADMVTGSRFKDKAFIPVMPRVKLAGNRMMSWLISRLVRARYYDVSCGFRSYNREALLRINLHGAFTYTQETFLDFSAKNVRILEVPVAVTYFIDRKSRVAGSIARYALNSATIILRGYRDYYPLRFFFGLALAFAVPGTIFGITFFLHFLLTGRFSGFLFAGFLSAFFLLLTVLMLIVGIVADMLDRIRANQDRILYILKKSLPAQTDAADVARREWQE